MKSLWVYRKTLLFNFLLSMGLYYAVYYLIKHNGITLPEKSLIKDISLTLLGFFGYLIGFLLTIMSILAASQSTLLDKLRKTSHYKNLITMSLLTALSMLLFCLYLLITLILNNYNSMFYVSLTASLFYFPIGMMVRLFHIYYLILSQ